MLRTPELKPYIIYIKAPPFEKLKETRHRAYARSTFDETSSRSFTVSSNKTSFLLNFKCHLLCAGRGILQYDQSR